LLVDEGEKRLGKLSNGRTEDDEEFFTPIERKVLVEVMR